MKATAAKHEWADFLRFYSEKNMGRLTRLGTFENQNGTLIDYWIEDGLPLTGIDIDADGDLPSIEIMLGDLTHTIKDARKLTAYFSMNTVEDGLDIGDIKGATTILRFESDR